MKKNRLCSAANCWCRKTKPLTEWMKLTGRGITEIPPQNPLLCSLHFAKVINHIDDEGTPYKKVNISNMNLPTNTIINNIYTEKVYRP